MRVDWIEDRRRQQEAIDLFKKLKYHQGYKDGKQGNEPRYPLKDEVGSASEDAAKEASDGKEGSEKPKDEDEDAEAAREEAQDTERRIRTAD